MENPRWSTAGVFVKGYRLPPPAKRAACGAPIRAPRTYPLVPIPVDFGATLQGGEGAALSTIASTTTLPATAGSLVGRERDLAALGALVVSSRIVTVTGPSGVGKTRLAVAAAARAVERYQDGAWLVELSSAQRGEDVARAVAAALSVDVDAGPLSLDTLARLLADRRLLLVLDSCEHLVDACAALAAQLVAGCPGLAVLATSQEPLGVAGEQRCPVEPLPVPAPGEETPGELARCPAAQLFVERTRAQEPGFALTDADAPAVADICRRLDGIPLAIELAAARVPSLGVTEIAARLDDRFRLLTGGARTAAPRHQTLQAALDWSHDLLRGAEQGLLRRLSVFAGGWTLDAAVGVCAGGPTDAGDVADLLDGLVRRSLVVADTGERPRYRLLDITRAYAAQRLADAGEQGRLQAAHLAWCLELAERAGAEMADGDQRAWLRTVEDEGDNLRVALTRALDGGDPDTARRLAGALVLFWSMRGRFQEGLAWLECARALDGGSPGPRALVLWGMALLARAVADFPAAKARAGECLELARREGDPRLEARALSVLGAVGVSACDGSTMTMSQLERSLELAVAHGDVWCQVAALVALGFGHLILGETAAAGARFEACARLAADHPDSEAHRVHALVGLGRVALARGRPDEATTLLEEAAAAARSLGILGAAANALRFLGEAASTRGEYAVARRHLDESLRLGRRMGAAVPTTLALSALGRLALDQGDLPAAARVLEDARALGVAEWSGLGAACALTGLGAVERAVGDPSVARERLDEALAAARSAGDQEAAARALHELGRVAHDDGENARAASLLHEALGLHRERGDRPAVAACIEVLARVEVEEGRLVAGARLLAAAERLREDGGYPRAPAEQPDFDADVALARRALGAEAFAAAWAQGASVPFEHAVRYAARGRGRRAAAGVGWTALSNRERDAVLLAAEGLTNREVGERMLVSARTVQTHLASAYQKLGVRSRRQLAEVAAREGALG